MRLLRCLTPALAAGVVFTVAGATAGAREAGVLPVVERPAIRVIAPERSVLLAVTRVGGRLVAAGERGVVVVSDDNGTTWRQADVPTSVTLTNVAFVDDRHGWAVGHSGVVLHSADGGITWQRQFDGTRAAAAVARDAATQHGRLATAYRKLAAQLVADGPDAPFLTVLAIDPAHAFIAGANGLFFATDDGGAHWSPRMRGIDNRRGLHYYALAAQGHTLFVTGEAGTFARSTDNGSSFTTLHTPYSGSFFGAEVTPAGSLVLVGFHGMILMSGDGGAHFRRITSPLTTTITGATLLPGGAIALTTQAGVLAELSPNGRVRVLAAPPLPLPAAITRAQDGSLIVVGFAGATRISMERPR